MPLDDVRAMAVFRAPADVEPEMIFASDPVARARAVQAVRSRARSGGVALPARIETVFTDAGQALGFTLGLDARRGQLLHRLCEAHADDALHVLWIEYGQSPA